MANLVFTTLDPSVYSDLSALGFLAHIIVAALRYETVLLRDQDLCFNERLASIFVGRENEVWRELLSELFATGVVKVNKMRLEHFNDEELATLSQVNPIRARALFVAKNSSYQAAQFDPDENSLPQFHAFIDGLLRDHPEAQKYVQPDANIPGKFRAEFLLTCDDCKAGFNDDPDFTTIRPTTLSRVGELLESPERAARFLNLAGIRLYGSAESPRSLVYHIAKAAEFRDDQSGIERLAQSIFASVYCQSESAEGVYNHLLPEPPASSDLEEATAEEEHAAKSLSTMPLKEIAISKGVGEAIMEIRRNPAKNHFLASAQATFSREVLRSTWEIYADEFEKQYSRYPPKQSGPSLMPLTISSGIAAGLSFGLKSLGFSDASALASDTSNLISGVSAVAFAWQLWRKRSTRRILHGAIRAALNTRYRKIELRSVQSRRASLQ